MSRPPHPVRALTFMYHSGATMESRLAIDYFGTGPVLSRAYLPS